MESKGANEMKKAIEIMITEAITELANVHGCSENDIINGLMSGSEKLANQLTELVGAAEKAIAEAAA
jgi:hypothetical protein